MESFHRSAANRCCRGCRPRPSSPGRSAAADGDRSHPPARRARADRASRVDPARHPRSVSNSAAGPHHQQHDGDIISCRSAKARAPASQRARHLRTRSRRPPGEGTRAQLTFRSAAGKENPHQSVAVLSTPEPTCGNKQLALRCDAPLPVCLNASDLRGSAHPVRDPSQSVRTELSGSGRPALAGTPRSRKQGATAAEPSGPGSLTAQSSHDFPSDEADAG
jgi:hypothetical protein